MATAGSAVGEGEDSLRRTGLCARLRPGDQGKSSTPIRRTRSGGPSSRIARRATDSDFGLGGNLVPRVVVEAKRREVKQRLRAIIEGSQFTRSWLNRLAPEVQLTEPGQQ